jgi:hypothetical protein
MRRLLLLIVFSLLFSFASHTQTDVSHRDSVRAIVEQVIRQKQDSLKEAKKLEQIKKNSKSLDVFLQEMKEREQVEKRRRWVRVGAGVFFFSLLLIISVRRYRARKRK